MTTREIINYYKRFVSHHCFVLMGILLIYLRQYTTGNKFTQIAHIILTTLYTVVSNIIKSNRVWSLCKYTEYIM